MKSTKTAWAIAISALGASAGCATAPVPADKLARTQQAVENAEQLRAGADPRAAAHLKLAKEELAQATRLMKNGDNKRATWTLARAEADAEAALYLAHARAAKDDAERTLEAIRQAMSTMQSGGEGS